MAAPTAEQAAPRVRADCITRRVQEWRLGLRNGHPDVSIASDL
jgi:hypothetical protein